MIILYENGKVDEVSVSNTIFHLQTFFTKNLIPSSIIKFLTYQKSTFCWINTVEYSLRYYLFNMSNYAIKHDN